ncbi:uncharacterized protein LOC124419217 [Lucilia cuprina]|uniref:uncharacterized protein LOC124419217 n=1 Tax=Lucilia cuprina TaxID=7375 RepID=UPI001F0572BD|nr:uncharacterized protein LOC124419217 [Lucilia cuprina]
MEAQKQLIDTLKSAGFPLKKITANHPDLLSQISSDDLLNTEFLKLYDSSSTKTLGIRWNAISDSFTYKVEQLNSTSSSTKRQILSAVAKLFDPAGWLTPIIIQAKILLQELWQDGVGWDDEVKPQFLDKWKIFVDSFPTIESIEIPRWIHYHPQYNIQIHGFCDASEQAYCATLYVVSENSGIRYSHLLSAKSKVAPLQRISLPRLELCGALLLSRLVKQVLTNLPICSPKLYLWSDSTIVLAWLQKPPSVWKTYVANRTTQIIENVGNASWNHVPTDHNPADLGTRGCKPQDLVNNLLWWYGPMWLLDSQANWPKYSSLPDALPEKRRISVCFSTPADNSLIDRFSSYPRALAVTAYVLRFISLTELKESKVMLIKLTQRVYYPQEYSQLSDAKLISKKSSILTLNPFLDSNGTMRVNGRLANSCLNYDERYPFIIPNSSNFCRMFLDFAHKTLLQADISLMMNAIQSQFYIPGLKRTVKKCVHHCLVCVRYKQKLKSQIMAALPPERCSFSLPFTYAC